MKVEIAKHTPGPWTIHPMRSSRTGLDAGRGFDYPWHIVRTSHASRPIGGSIDKEYDRTAYAHQICTFGDFSRFEREEVAANARLIAAAPELLDALEFVDRLYSTIGGVRDSSQYGLIANSNECGAMINAVRAAIRKAKGEDQ